MDALFFAGVIVLLIVLLMGKEYIDSRTFQRRMLKKLYQSYGEVPDRKYGAEELSHISMYYQKHRTEEQIDDITWNDLHLDEIYERMNTSCSAAGDEYLYYRLHTPVFEEEQMEDMEKRICFFMEHETERQKVQSIFYQLGRMRRYSIYEYLDNLESLGERKNGAYLLYDLAALAGFGIMFQSLPVGLVVLLIVLCHNLIGYFKEYKEIEPYISSFRYIRRLLGCAQQMGQEEIQVIAGKQARLRECHRKLKSFLRNSYLVISAEKGNGNPLELVLDYLRMLFYLDLIQFNRALASLRGHMDEVDEMITILGQIETDVVVGAWRTRFMGEYCVPRLHYDGKDKFLKVEELYHPLLPDPVKNSVSVERGVLLTGSNASGKSTFLRAVAVSGVLAQTIHTCPASCYEAPVFRIYSSMSLRDNLSGGDSYYMVEIKSIKRILDQVMKKDGRPVLCFVDEVLRGTNTVERIAASTQIMKMLARGRTLCFAATHDVELTRLLASAYENYHFEEKIEEEDIYFPYLLRKGPATSRNAIALLKMLGYDRGIVEEAEAMAEGFLDSGSWGM